MTQLGSVLTEFRELCGMDPAQMESLLAEGGFPRYRARQLHHWVYRRLARSLDEMDNLPRGMREWLKERVSLDPVRLVRAEGPADGTRKVLWHLRDGRFIESVVMRDEGVGRTSLCISSQVGCALGCSFCLTGFGGFQRNLTAAEIVGQVLAVRRDLMAADEPLHHLVFMGMGEPMLNLDAVLPAIRILADPDGVGLSRRRITVSTAGVVTGIERFGLENPGVSLAVSLNATTDVIRDAIMPINRKWPIPALLRALESFPLDARRRITIEYVLLRGVNDTPEDARRLVRLLRELRCKVNLIMFNPSPHLPYESVSEETLNHFARALSQAQYTVTVRWSKGREIEAACGQLAAHYFQPPVARFGPKGDPKT